MKLTIKAILRALVAPILCVTLISMGMDNPTKKEIVVRPTIKAKIYLAPKKPAFYLTGAQLKYLNEKGIPTPAIAVGRTVEKVEVIESDDSITNWINNTTEKIHTYESKKLCKEKLSFAEHMQKNLALDSLTFPHTLPVELIFNCSNGSHINLTIHGFPVQATLESTKNFHTEQTKCMQKFYKQAASHLSQHQISSLIKEGKLTETTDTFPLTIFGPFSITVIKKNYNHGPNGCANEKRFIELMAAKQTKPHNNNAFHLVQNRQIGARAGQRHPNPQINLDLILENSLEDMISTERINKAALDADEKLLSDCYNDFIVQENIKKELTEQHTYLPKNKSDRHVNECTLF